MTYRKEERFELTYISKKTGETKRCYPRSAAGKDEQLAKCKEYGVKVISCKKLYPFNTEKNQHNFELIHNICMNRLHDIYRNGEPEQYKGEADRLKEMKEKSENLFCLPLPVAWVTWETLKDAKELSAMAINHRMDACAEAGRYDLIGYCAM